MLIVWCAVVVVVRCLFVGCGSMAVVCYLWFSRDVCGLFRVCCLFVIDCCCLLFAGCCMLIVVYCFRVMFVVC